VGETVQLQVHLQARRLSQRMIRLRRVRVQIVVKVLFLEVVMTQATQETMQGINQEETTKEINLEVGINCQQTKSPLKRRNHPPSVQLTQKAELDTAVSAW
jgi:hypothetical protein